MRQLIQLIRKIPGWVAFLAVFGTLYATGLHTEAIGQVQRLLLATGIKNADVPEPGSFMAETPPSNPARVGDGFRMVDLNGDVVSLEQLRGKVVFLNVWATWCPPCIAEMPSIQSLYEKVGSDKIGFVMLSVDDGGPEKVRRFIERKGYTFPVYLPASSFPDAFYSSSIPTTFIISPEGYVVSRQEGMASYDTKKVREFLQGLAP